jgi:hypothetical protein
MNSDKEVIMSQQDTSSDSLRDSSASRPLSEPIADLLREIQQIPREYWPNLLQLIRLFRESVALKPGLSTEPMETVVTEMSQAERMQRNQAAIELLRSWEEEGDEQEQTETWEYLRRVLDEDRLSNRPLFP